MKLSLLTAFALTLIAAPAFADDAIPLPPPIQFPVMETIVNCKAARGMVGGSMNLVIRRDRLNGSVNAVFDQTIAGQPSTQITVSHVTHSIQGSQDIYTGPSQVGDLKLSIDMQITVEGNWNEALMLIDGGRYQMLCQRTAGN